MNKTDANKKDVRNYYNSTISHIIGFANHRRFLAAKCFCTLKAIQPLATLKSTDDRCNIKMSHGDIPIISSQCKGLIYMKYCLLNVGLVNFKRNVLHFFFAHVMEMFLVLSCILIFIEFWRHL